MNLERTFIRLAIKRGPKIQHADLPLGALLATEVASPVPMLLEELATVEIVEFATLAALQLRDAGRAQVSHTFARFAIADVVMQCPDLGRPHELHRIRALIDPLGNLLIQIVLLEFAPFTRSGMPAVIGIRFLPASLTLGARSFVWEMTVTPDDGARALEMGMQRFDWPPKIVIAPAGTLQ